MKKVLIITTHFAPDRHVGAKRPSKFVKYLPEFGWTPVIITREKKDFHGIDHSLCDDLSKDVKIFYVKKWRFSNNTDNTKSANGESANATTRRISCKLIPFVRKFIGWLSIYDYGWLLSAFYNGRKLMKEKGIDVLFSTSPDPVAHLVGLGLKIVTGKPWVADFRDPWTVLHANYRTGCFKMGIHRMCEKVVVTTANHVTAISHIFTQNLKKLRNRRKKDNVFVIYNGYDKDDFDKIDKKALNIQQPFTITYLGTWGSYRSPEPFLRSLGNLFVKHPNFKNLIRVNFVGEVKWDRKMEVCIEQVMLEENLDGVVKIMPFLSCRKGLALLGHSDVSLLVVAPYHSRVGCLSSKLFEYLYAGKPILALVPPESEEAHIIRATNAGKIVDPDDVIAISKKIEEMYIAYKKNDLVVDINTCAIERFDRRRQTRELAALFNEQIANMDIKGT